MVLGFGSGQRFKEVKEMTPGPGQYSPNDPRYTTNAEIKSSFMGAERFTPDAKEAPLETPRSDVATPRDRKIRAHNPGDGRKFTWATQRIHDLSKELESVHKHLHVMEDERRGEREHLVAEAEHYLNEIESLKGMLQASESDKQLIGAKAREAESHITQLQEAASAAAAAHNAALADKQATLDVAQQQVAGLQEEAQHTAELLRVAEESKDIITAELEAMLSKVAMLERDLATEQQALAGRTSELDSARSEIQALQQQHQTAQHDLETLQQHAAHVEALLADAQADAQALTAQLSDVSQSLHSRESSLAEREAQLTEAQHALTAANEHAASQQVVIAQRVQELEAAEKHVAELQSTLDERDASIASLCGTLEEERANLQQVLASLQGVQGELERSMQQAAQEQQALQGELAEVKEALQTLQAQHQELLHQAEQQREDLTGQVDSLTGQVGTLTASVTSLNNQLEEATGQCFSLKVELNNERAAKGAEQRAHDETKAFFSASLAAKEAQVAASQERDEALRQDLRRQLEAVGGAGGGDMGARELVKAVAEATAARMQGMRDEANGLRGKLQDTSAVALELEGLVQAKDQAAQEDAEQMLELRGALKSVEGVLQATREQLALQLAEGEAQNAALLVQLKAVGEEKAQLGVQLRDAEADKAQLTAQLGNAEADKAQLGVQLRDAEADKAQLTAQLGDAEADKAQLGVQLRDAEADKAQLTAQLGDAEADKAQLTAQLKEMRQGTTSLAAQLEDTEASRVQLQSDLETLTQQVLHRDAALKEATAEVAEAKQETRALLDSVSALEQQLVAAKAEATDAQEAAAMATVELQAALSNASATGAALAAHKTRVGDLEGQLARMTDAHAADREAYQQLARAHDALRGETDALQEAVQRNAALVKQHEAASTAARKQATEAQAELQQLHKRLAATPKGKDAAARVAVLEHELKAALQEGDRVRGMAQQAETALLENRRLGEDNAVLAARVKQLQVDLQELTDAGVLGHNNPKQKIQYHLRLKQELEELRNECTVLLRERLHLEQCIRYLSARANLPGDPAAAEAAEVQASIPASTLAKSAMFVTPMGRRSAALAGRGRVAHEEQQGTAYRPKAELQAAIAEAVMSADLNARALAAEVGVAAPQTSQPESVQPDAEDGNAVETSILRRIWDVCSPAARQARAARRASSRAGSTLATPRGETPRGDTNPADAARRAREAAMMLRISSSSREGVPRGGWLSARGP